MAPATQDSNPEHNPFHFLDDVVLNIVSCENKDDALDMQDRVMDFVDLAGLPQKLYRGVMPVADWQPIIEDFYSAAVDILWNDSQIAEEDQATPFWLKQHAKAFKKYYLNESAGLTVKLQPVVARFVGKMNDIEIDFQSKGDQDKIVHDSKRLEQKELIRATKKEIASELVYPKLPDFKSAVDEILEQSDTVFELPVEKLTNLFAKQYVLDNMLSVKEHYGSDKPLLLSIFSNYLLTTLTNAGKTGIKKHEIKTLVENEFDRYGRDHSLLKTFTHIAWFELKLNTYFTRACASLLPRSKKYSVVGSDAVSELKARTSKALREVYGK